MQIMSNILISHRHQNFYAAYCSLVLVSLPVFVHSLSLLMYNVNWSKYVKPHVHFFHRRNVNMSKLSHLFKKEIK